MFSTEMATAAISKSKTNRNVTVEPLFFILWFTGGMAWGGGAFNELELWRVNMTSFAQVGPISRLVLRVYPFLGLCRRYGVQRHCLRKPDQGRIRDAGKRRSEVMMI